MGAISALLAAAWTRKPTRNCFSSRRLDASFLFDSSCPDQTDSLNFCSDEKSQGDGSAASEHNSCIYQLGYLHLGNK